MTVDVVQAVRVSLERRTHLALTRRCSVIVELLRSIVVAELEKYGVQVPAEYEVIAETGVDGNPLAFRIMGVGKKVPALVLEYGSQTSGTHPTFAWRTALQAVRDKFRK